MFEALFNELMSLPLKDKLYRHSISDFKGLSLQIYPTGIKSLVYRYTISQKSQSIVLGNIATMTLTDFDEKINEINNYRILIKQGIDPKSVNTKNPYENMENPSFAIVSELWFNYKYSDLNPSTKANVRRNLDYLNEKIGTASLLDITTPTLLYVLESIQKEKTFAIGKECRRYIENVYEFAQLRGICENNPAYVLRKYLKGGKKRNMPALVVLDDFTRLVIALHEFKDCHPIVYNALNILPFVFVRSADLRNWQWADIDFNKKQWIFSPKKQTQENSVKTLVVPLAPQVIEILEHQKILAGDSKFVFPSPFDSNKIIGKTTLWKCLEKLGFKGEQSPHGFRASAKTLLMELDELRFSHITTELQLGHTVKDNNGNAYQRMSDIDNRTIMMNRWAQFIDEIKKTSH